jgi:hypothetical protein
VMPELAVITHPARRAVRARSIPLRRCWRVSFAGADERARAYGRRRRAVSG